MPVKTPNNMRYKAVLVHLPDVIDLVNVNDPSDRFPANPDDFVVGETYDESQLKFESVTMVSEESAYSGSMAFLEEDIDTGDDDDPFSRGFLCPKGSTLASCARSRLA